MAGCVTRRCTRDCGGDEVQTPRSEPLHLRELSEDSKGIGPGAPTSRVLVLVLGPSTKETSAALALRRELPRLFEDNGLHVQYLQFPKGSSSALAGREVLVLSAKKEQLVKLAEQSGIPKEVDQGAFGTLWQPFRASHLSRYVGGDNLDLFFTEAETLNLLKYGALAIPTVYIESFCSPEELASLRNAHLHHRAVRAAERQNVIAATLAFHNPEKLQDLRAKWFPWRPLAPLPIQELADYFGAQAVHYFSFVQQYVNLLMFPAALGVAARVLHALLEISRGETMSFSVFAQVTTPLVIIWATIFVEKWRRTLNITRHSLGLHVDESHAELLTPLSQVHMPSVKRTDEGSTTTRDRVGFRYAWTISAMFLLFGMTSVVIHLLLVVGDVVEKWSDNIVVQNLPLALYMGVVEVLQRVYTGLATWLTDQERHMMRGEYMKSLTMKTAFFQIINYHGWFLYLAFWRQDLDYLRSQLLVFFTVKQVIGNVVEVVLPMFQAAKSTHSGEKKVNTKAALSRMLTSNLGSASSLESLVEEHFMLQEPSAFDDYLEMSVMFAALVLYYPVFPLGGLLALLHAVFENFSDAYKYCSVQRRKIPEQMDDVIVEVWLEIFDSLSYLGVCSSIALIWIETGSTSGLQLVLFEHLLLFFKGYLAWSIPDCPEWIEAQECSQRERLKEDNVRKTSSLRLDGSPVATPEMLEVRPIAATGLTSRWGGLLQRHPVIRLKHGGLTYNTKVIGESGTPSTASSGSVSESASTQDRGVLPGSCWSDAVWFSLPYRSGTDLIAEVLSLERPFGFRSPQPVVLGTATFPAEQLPRQAGGGAAVQLTQTLTGPGVMEGASVMLELRCM